MRARALGGQAIWSFAGYLFTLLVGLPLQVLVARTIGAEGLGAFSLVEAVIDVLVTILSFGLAQSVVKFIPDLIDQSQHKTIRRLIRRDTLSLGTAGIVIVIIGSVLVDEFRKIPGLAQISYFAFVLALFMVPLSLLIFYYQQVLRGLLAVRQIVLGTSVIQLSVKAVILVFVFWLGMGIDGLILSVIVSASIAVVYVGTWAYRLTNSSEADSGRDLSDFWSRHASFARIQYLTGLFGLTSLHVDRFLLGFFSGVSAVGVLGVARTLSIAPSVFLQMLVAASSPLFSRAHARNDLKDAIGVYHLAVDWSVRLSWPFFIFIAVFANSILGFYGTEFSEKGEQTLYIFICASALNALTGPLGMFLMMWGGERAILRLQVLNQFIILSSYVILLPTYGLLGAAIANLLSMLVSVIAGYFTARHLIKVTWYDKRYLRWILPIVGFLGASLLFREAALFELSATNLIVLFFVLTIVFHSSFLIGPLHEDDAILLGAVWEKLKPLIGKLKS